MIFTKKLRDTVPNDSVRYLLHKHLSDYQDVRPLSSVHGSSVTKDGGICARMYGLADLTGEQEQPEWLTTSQAVTFELGHMLEARLIHWFSDMGFAITNWVCQSCGTVADFSARPEECYGCGNRMLKPENYRFVSKKTGISCGIDLMLKRPAHHLIRILEIKTMDKDEFKELKAPLAEHRLRTQLYLRCIAESDDPRAKLIDTTAATILYTTKGGYGVKDPEMKLWGLHDSFSPFKEFKVLRNDKDLDDMVEPAKKVLMFRKGLMGLPQHVCPHANVDRAKTCRFKKACFSGDYPAGMNKI